MTIFRMALGLAAASAAAVMYSNRRKRSGSFNLQSADRPQRYGTGSGMGSGMESSSSTGMGSTPGTDWQAGLSSGASGGRNDDLLSPESGPGLSGSRGGTGL